MSNHNNDDDNNSDNYNDECDNVNVGTNNSKVDNEQKTVKIITFIILFLGLGLLIFYLLASTVPKFGNGVASYFHKLAKHKPIQAVKSPFEYLKPIKVIKSVSSSDNNKNSKHIISYSLWGTGPKYINGAIQNAKSVKEIYGDNWKSRWYIDSTIPQHCLEEFKKLDNCEIILMPDNIGSIGMYWRFLVFSDPSCHVALVRDADSTLTKREALAVEEWIRLKDKYPLHLIHDVNSFRAIIGGSFGGVAKELKPIIDNLQLLWTPNFQYGDDEDFLSYILFPRFLPNRILDHDSFLLRRNAKSWRAVDFPTKKQPGEPSVCQRNKETF